MITDATSYMDRTSTIIDQYCREKTSRNAVLANIKLHSIKAKAGVEHQKPLVSACIQYFDRYCAKVTCFQDLRPYVANLDRDERSGLLQAMRSCAVNRRPINDADNVSLRSVYQRLMRGSLLVGHTAELGHRRNQCYEV